MTSLVRMTVAALLIITGAAVMPEAASYMLDFAVQSNPPARQAAPPAANPCAAPANEIVAENCKPGNDSTEWDINGNGDPSIQGFATDISVDHGDTIGFKVRTVSPKYRIDIYRMGYYQGLGARRVATIAPSATLPQRQPDCLQDYPVKLVDCGNWAVSASWAVPADAVSGVYIARLVREDPDPNPNWRTDNSQEVPVAKPLARPHAYGANGLGKLRNPIKEPRASHIIFVVRDDEGKSDILVQTSDQAWEVYNPWGGASSYTGYVQGLATGQANRAFKVSYNRPFQNRPSTFSVIDWYFNAEYPMTRFLEANGYDVSYFTGVDAARHGSRIKDHKLYLSVGHDEYWSSEQRKNVEAARDAGVNLAFFSGNEVFWKIRYENSTEGSNTPHRTIGIYKETHSRIADDGQLRQGSKIDPVKEVWTGTWRDSSAFNPEGAQPENALTGTIFTVNAWRNEPLEVPAEFAKMRFWRNTEVARLKPGEKAVLGKGILGHEWDEDLDNGFRPKGLIHLSRTTVHDLQYIQDFGSVYDSGTATHTLTLYKVPSGALVFGAGTVQWSWGLDDFHDSPSEIPAQSANRYSIRVGRDLHGPVKAIQQATVNLFADMGVQPATLLRGLVPATRSTDAMTPVARIVSPLEGSPVRGPVLNIEGIATDRGGGVIGGVEVSVDGGSSWHPADGRERWAYAWVVPTGVTSATILCRAADDSGNVSEPRSIRIRIGKEVTH